MKLNSLPLIVLLCGAPFAANAGLDIGIGVNLGGPVVVQTPPAPRHEHMGYPPFPGAVWIHGHWDWHHGRWEWRDGHWEAPRAGFVWVEGHWNNTPQGYVWTEGSWAPAQPVMAPPPPPAPPQVVVQGPPSPPGPSGQVMVDIAPPMQPQYENVPPSPGPDFFWIAGRWNWDGRRWVWLHGRYERHPHFHPGAAWVSGHWDHHDGRYFWVEGHWI